MQRQVFDIVTLISSDVESKLPKGFETKYYNKMTYSNENIIIELDEKLQRKTISFEIAFIHFVLYIFNKTLRYKRQHYSDFLKKLDADSLFSWYELDISFVEYELHKLKAEDYLDIYSLVNLHDKFIHKSVKKRLGQFYTPIEVVQRMIMEIKCNIQRLGIEDSIADPACGTGVFIVETLNLLGSKFTLDELIEYSNNNVYAFDVNPFAILATKINILYVLYLKAESQSTKIHNFVFETDSIFQNVQWKNTIVEDDLRHYTIILGNPPYFKLNNKLIKNICGYSEILYGQPNIYSFFMFWSMQHLKKDGVMCFIVPQSIRSGLYFKNLRAKMYNLRIRSMIHIDSRQNVFDRVEQAVLIICLENKTVANSKTKIQFYDVNGSIKSEFKIARSKLMMDETYNNIFVINRKREMYDILDKVYHNSSRLGNERGKLKFCNGLFVWNQHKDDIVDYEDSAIPIIYGGNVQPKRFNFNQCSTNEERKQFARMSNKTKQFVMTGKRLLVQRTTNFEKDIKLKACIIDEAFLADYKTYFLENHVNFLGYANQKDNLVEDKIMYYYLGMLNSKLVNYIFTSKSGNTQVSINELNSLPFPLFDSENLAEFVSKKEADLEKYQDELDLIVCKSYGLTEAETSFIMNLGVK